jgi:hypothetical protein
VLQAGPLSGDAPHGCCFSSEAAVADSVGGGYVQCMRSTELVTAPDGSEWEVGRRWMDRSPPKLFRRRRAEGGNEGRWLDFAPVEFGSIDDFLSGILVAIVAAAVIALFVFVILPLLGIALEFALLIMLLASGVVSRVFLRRPWTIEAVRRDASGNSVTFAVVGWRRSRRAIDDLKTAIAQTGVPAQLPEAVPLSPRSHT